MRMVFYCSALLAGMVLFCVVSEAAIQFNSEPENPSFAVEGQNFSLVWTYTLADSFQLAGFANSRILGSLDLIGRTRSPGNVTIQAKYKQHFRAHVSNNQAELTIHAIHRTDRGKYQFALSPADSATITGEVEVIVQFAPEITYINGGDVTVDEHSSILLLCEASGVPTPDFTWTRLHGNGSETEEHKGKDWPIPNISRDFNGTYRCTADNGIGSPDDDITRITISYPPKIARFPTEYSSPAEQSVSLECKADGYPSPSYSWTPCEENDNVCNQSVLTISEVKNDQVYTCTATNRLGSDSANIPLVIADDVINVTFVVKSKNCTYNKILLEEELDIEMSNLFNASSCRHTTVNDLSCGSSIVNLALGFSSVVKEEYVLNVLKDAAKDGMLGRFEVDASSIKGTRRLDGSTTPPTGGTTPPAPDNMILNVLGAVLGPLAFAAVVVLIILYLLKKNACGKETNGALPS